MILELGMKHRGMEVYTDYINHDPEMTLTYSILHEGQGRKASIQTNKLLRLPMHLNWENGKMSFNG